MGHGLFKNPEGDKEKMKNKIHTVHYYNGVVAERVRIHKAIQKMIKPGSTKVYCFCNWTYVKPEDVLKIVEGK